MNRNRPPTSTEVLITPRRGVVLPIRERFSTTAALTWVWAGRDLRSRYRQSVLRSAWSFLQPVAILATYGWVLTAVLDVDSGGDVAYLTFAWAGIVPFTFFSTALGQGVGSVQQAGPVVTRIWFPREVLPLAVVATALVDLGIMILTLIAIAWVQVGPPTIHLLGLVPSLGMLLLWATACTVLTSGLTVYRRDLNFATPLALRVLFIVTPVMYPASLIAGVAPWLNAVNPLTVAIEGTRDAIYRDVWPDWLLLGAQSMAAVGATVLALTVFRRLEPRMSDYL